MAHPFLFEGVVGEGGLAIGSVLGPDISEGGVKPFLDEVVPEVVVDDPLDKNPLPLLPPRLGLGLEPEDVLRGRISWEGFVDVVVELLLKGDFLLHPLKPQPGKVVLLPHRKPLKFINSIYYPHYYPIIIVNDHRTFFEAGFQGDSF